MAIEHCGERFVVNGAKLGAVRIVALMIFPNEVVPAVLAGMLRLYPPEHELPKGVALHQAVKQVTNLLWPPDKFPLNRR